VITIEHISDEIDCECCGGSYAYGAVVTMPNGEILDLTPLAYCYDGVSYDDREILIKIIENLGYTLEWV
jgi:hypothetical protein